MAKRIFKGLAAIIAVMLLMVMAAIPVSAADMRSGGTINISSGQVIDDDLYLAGTTVNIDGTINGDVVVVANTININGTVNGGVLAAAATINLKGKVEGSFRCAGGTINIEGGITRDLVAVTGELIVADGAQIGGDILLGGDTASINGTVLGDIDAAINRLTLGSSAKIQGHLTYTSQNEFDKDPGAQISGAVKRHTPPRSNPFIGWIISFVMMLVTGIVVILLLPGKMTGIVDSIKSRPWPSLGWGALVLFCTPVAIMVLLITIIGAPLAVILAVLYGIALYLAQIPMSIFLGHLAIGRSREIKSRGLIIAAYAIGLAVLSLLELIPFIGWLFWLAAALLGLGGLFVLVKDKPASAV